MSKTFLKESGTADINQECGIINSLQVDCKGTDTMCCNTTKEAANSSTGYVCDYKTTCLENKLLQEKEIVFLTQNLFNKIKASTKGGKAGQWSARKAQMLAKEYKAKGGGYK